MSAGRASLRPSLVNYDDFQGAAEIKYGAHGIVHYSHCYAVAFPYGKNAWLCNC